MDTTMTQKLVVIGNGMAGCRAVEEILKRDPGRYAVTIFGAEPRVNYNRIMLSPVLAGEQTLNEIMLNDLDWYAQHDITLHLGKTVTRIDRRRRVACADDGTEAAQARFAEQAPGERVDQRGEPLVQRRVRRRDVHQVGGAGVAGAGIGRVVR